MISKIREIQFERRKSEVTARTFETSTTSLELTNSSSSADMSYRQSPTGSWKKGMSSAPSSKTISLVDRRAKIAKKVLDVIVTQASSSSSSSDDDDADDGENSHDDVNDAVTIGSKPTSSRASRSASIASRSLGSTHGSNRSNKTAAPRRRRSVGEMRADLEAIIDLVMTNFENDYSSAFADDDDDDTSENDDLLSITEQTPDPPVIVEASVPPPLSPLAAAEDGRWSTHTPGSRGNKRQDCAIPLSPPRTRSSRNVVQRSTSDFWSEGTASPRDSSCRCPVRKADVADAVDAEEDSATVLEESSSTFSRSGHQQRQQQQQPNVEAAENGASQQQEEEEKDDDDDEEEEDELEVEEEEEVEVSSKLSEASDIDSLNGIEDLQKPSCSLMNQQPLFASSSSSRHRQDSTDLQRVAAISAFVDSTDDFPKCASFNDFIVHFGSELSSASDDDGRSGDDSDESSVLSDLTGMFHSASNEEQTPGKEHRDQAGVMCLGTHLQDGSVHAAGNNNSLERRSSVSFSTVTIRRYERILSDNPSVSDGPSIGIGWNFEAKDPVDVDEYEDAKSVRRPSDLLLSRPVREKIVRSLGYTESEIASSIRSLAKSKNNRRQTVVNLNTQKVEEAMETAKRQVKKILAFPTRATAGTRSSF